MFSRNLRDVFALTVLLLPLPASAALYQIPSSGITPNLYLNETSAAGQFISSGILPQGSQIRNASIKFAFRDDADDMRRVNYNSHPDIGDWVEQPAVYNGYDVHHNFVRAYNRISQSEWLYDYERVDVLLNGLRTGTAEPARTTTSTSSVTPVGWQWDHGGSSRYLYGYDANGRPIFGTSYYDYYNNVAKVDVNIYLGNEDNFLFTDSLDNPLLALLQSGDPLNFKLDVTTGDLLFVSATLFVETVDNPAVPEPGSTALILAGLASIALLRRRALTH